MTDIFLRGGATPADDIILRDPTAPDAGGAINAALAVVEADDVLSSAATVLVSANAVIAEADDALISTATAAIAASLAVVEADDSIVGAGTVSLSAALSIVEEDDAPLAAETVLVEAEAGILEEADSVLAEATVVTSLLAEALLFEDSDVIAASAEVTDAPAPPPQIETRVPFGGGGFRPRRKAWALEQDLPVLVDPKNFVWRIAANVEADLAEEGDRLVASAAVSGRSRRRRDEELLMELA